MYLNLPIINSGVIFGSVMNILHLLAQLVSLPDYVDFTVTKYEWGIDQAFLGMLYYRGILKDAGVNLTVLNDTSPYASLFHCRFALHRSDDDPILSKRTRQLYSVIHQYNRYNYLINYTSRNCPSDDPWAFSDPRQTQLA
jgi:hypothetical protein